MAPSTQKAKTSHYATTTSRKQIELQGTSNDKRASAFELQLMLKEEAKQVL
jgi:hypothetical protein